MPRGKLITTVWWDTKLSNGKTPKEIVNLIGNDLYFTEQNVKQILTRLLSLKDKKFFKKGQSTTAALLICTYLCANEWKIGKEPISPWKFSRICNKHGFRVSYSVLMKGVREAKNAKYFKKGMSAKEIINRYRNRMIYLFHFSDKFLGEIHTIVSQNGIEGVVGGTSPFAISAGIVFYHSKARGLFKTQEEICNFFGVSQVSVRNFHQHYLKLVEKIDK